MKNYIFLLIVVLLLTSCKTTKEDYSQYTFIGENIKNSKYEILTLVPDKYELKNMLGYTLTSNGLFLEKEKYIWDMPLIYFNKGDNIFYIIYDRENSVVHYVNYNILSNKKDTIKNEDSIKIYNRIFEKNYKKNSDLVDFKFPEAEKYYKIVNKESHSEISEEGKNKVLEEYKDSSEEIKKDIIKLVRYDIVQFIQKYKCPKRKSNLNLIVI